MLLAVDIGNTKIKTGIFDNDVVHEKFNFNTSQISSKIHVETELLKIIKKFNITDCSICSVVEGLDLMFLSVCKDVGIRGLVLNSETSPIELAVENPQTVGADRISNAYAAAELYGYPVIVIDCGTAITFDVVSYDKKFVGGIIMPGLEIQLNSLAEHTSKLPRVSVSDIDYVIGNSTEKAVKSGVINGIAGAIDGLINKFENEFKKAPVIVGTGGQSEYISKYMTKKFDKIDSDLTLKGLRLFNC